MTKSKKISIKPIVYIPIGIVIVLSIIMLCDWVVDNARPPFISCRKPALTQNIFPMNWDVNNKKLFIFDPKIPAWAAYDANGRLVMSGDASGGRDYCKDIDSSCHTPVGTFHVYDKQDADYVSSEFPIETDDDAAGGAPMPYCMHFEKGYAIHGSHEVAKHNASHGCVRVCLDAAQWLNENFIEIGTPVLVLPYFD